MKVFSEPFQTRFLNLPNCFLIQRKWKGSILSPFLPNSGRLQELLFPCSKIHLIRKDSPNRKTHWNYIEKEARDRGSYLLILKLERKRNIHVGKLGGIIFREGFYVYVGSAMANLSKRMERHRHLRKRHHWHIDELRAVAEFHSALAIRSLVRLECEIAKALSKIAEWSVPGFGSTDCSCKTHLFGMSNDPLHSEDFHQLLQYFRNGEGDVVSELT